MFADLHHHKPDAHERTNFNSQNSSLRCLEFFCEPLIESGESRKRRSGEKAHRGKRTGKPFNPHNSCPSFRGKEYPAPDPTCASHRLSPIKKSHVRHVCSLVDS